MPGKAPSHWQPPLPGVGKVSVDARKQKFAHLQCAHLEVCRLTGPRRSIHLPCAARLLGPGRVESSASHAHSHRANAHTPVRQASAGDCAMCGYVPGEQGRYHGQLPPPEDTAVQREKHVCHIFPKCDIRVFPFARQDRGRPTQAAQPATILLPVRS